MTEQEIIARLQAAWDEISVAPKHVTWWGIHCQLAAYTRKNP